MNLDPDQPITRPRTPTCTTELAPTDEINTVGRHLLLGQARIVLADDPDVFRQQAFELAIAAGALCARAQDELIRRAREAQQ